MKRLLNIMQKRGFYVALAMGVIALATMMVLYDYKDAKDELAEDSMVDLNKIKVAENADDGDADINIAANSKAAISDKKATSDKDEQNVENKNDSEKPNDDKNTDDKEVIKENEQVADNAKIADEDKVKINQGTLDMAGSGTAGSGNLIAEAASPEVKAPAEDTEFNYEGKGGMIWPLEGNIIMDYSMDRTVYFKTLDTYKCNPGILIGAAEGTAVYSAYEGRVSSIEDTNEYGAVVTIDLGNGYKAIYGQLMNITVSVGDTVAMSEKIAQVGPVSNYYEKEGHHLFFEITKDGNPINPIAQFK